MSDNPYEQPGVQSASRPQVDRIPHAHGLLSSLFSRFFSVAIDFVLHSVTFAAVVWMDTIHEDETLKAKVGVGLLVLFHFCAQIIPAYFRGGTIGMAILALRVDSPGIRGLFFLGIRSLGFVLFWLAFTILYFLAPMINQTVGLTLGLVMFISPILQVLSGIFIFGRARLTLQDRITRTRIVYTGRILRHVR